MNKPVHISSNNKVNYKIETHIKPEKIYVPLENKNRITYKSLVKEGDYVHKGQMVAINEKLNFPVHSSVSGIVEKETEKMIGNGKNVKCIAIKNDFKEKYEKRKMIKKEISSYTKESFVEALKNNGISGLGGSDFPTYIKYSIDDVRYLLVNAVECEPFITCDKAVIHNYAEEILEAVDNIMEILKIKRAYIVMKEANTDSIKMINKHIGTYPNIKISLVKDAYPNGWERLVVRNTLGIEYDKYPSEKNVVVSNLSTIYSIYEMLEHNKALTERVITVSGPGIKKRTNVKVKIGSLASEVISGLEGYKNIKNPLFIVGGPMMGSSLPTDEVVITKDINCILVIEDHFEKNLPCIKCGKCMEVCPVGICPVLIMNNRDNENDLNILKPEKCIECGLCSYICPSKIEVREFVRIAKEKVNNK